jgi:hypothetical protein
MVTTFYPPEASATGFSSSSPALIARGHRVSVIASRDATARPAAARAGRPRSSRSGLRLESPFGFISPLITQLTGRPGIKSRATRDILDRPFDVVHFHNISLVGGPGVLLLGNAPVRLYTIHEHWLLCPTHVFWKEKNRLCDVKTSFTCQPDQRLPATLALRFSSV